MKLLLSSTVHVHTHPALSQPHTYITCYNVFAILYSRACILWPDAILNKLKYSHPDFHLCTFPHPNNNFAYSDTIQTASDESSHDNSNICFCFIRKVQFPTIFTLVNFVDYHYNIYDYKSLHLTWTVTKLT